MFSVKMNTLSTRDETETVSLVSVSICVVVHISTLTELRSSIRQTYTWEKFLTQTLMLYNDVSPGNVILS